MNVVVIVGVALVVVAIATVVTMQVRPQPTRTHLTVADLRARLAEEDERLLVERDATHELGRSA
ncbi:hypothetical protein ACIHDR_42270 [Nocardia sp. NPDC052278]|uniref:hypothetical protein n=1 Tax=unclassified Nocardia TaxID=2637762 RepID=UPI0036A6EAA3